MNWPTGIIKALARGLAALSPDCKEAARLQSVAFDRKLGFFEKLGLRCHLVLCEWCRRYGQQIAFLHSAAQKQAQDDKSATTQGLSLEARGRIKRRLQSEKF